MIDDAPVFLPASWPRGVSSAALALPPIQFPRARVAVSALCIALFAGIIPAPAAARLRGDTPQSQPAEDRTPESEPPTLVLTPAPPKAESLIADAHEILVVEIAPDLSRELAARNDDPERLIRAVAEALEKLQRASSDLKDRPADDASRRRLLEHRALLDAFGRAFRAIAAAPASHSHDSHAAGVASTRPAAATRPDAHAALLEQCSDLAIYLDDARPGVVDSARLWLAVAYRRAGRPDRADQVLGPLLGGERPSRIEYWAALNKCLALAEQGRFVAASAAALRVGKRLEKWFPDDDAVERDQARRALTWVQQLIREQWAVAEASHTAATSAPAPEDAPPSLDLLPLKKSIEGLPLPRMDANEPPSPASTQPADSPSSSRPVHP